MSRRLLLALLLAGPAGAQTFTPVTDGPPVSDGGASRGVTWVDYDGDGHLDLFVTNSVGGQFLYHNDGPPAFSLTRVTVGALPGSVSEALGCTWGDFDGDGDPDPFVANFSNQHNRLFTNDGGGAFTRVTAGPVVSDGGLSETGAWGDYDRDGDLDLFVGNSDASGPGTEQPNFLYRNEGAGEFTRVAGAGPITDDRHATRGVAWVDYDGDGDEDAFAANAFQPNALYRNRLAETGTASFEPVTAGPVVEDDAFSIAGAWGDYDNDGDLDLFVTHFLDQDNALYRNEGGGAFTRVTGDVVVSDGGYSYVPAWGDFDNDGDLDLFVTNVNPPAALPNVLYENGLMQTGTAAFTKVTAGAVVTDARVFTGAAWGDYDADGDLDLFAAVAGDLNGAGDDDNVLYRNDEPAGNAWLRLDLVGAASNRTGIGAKVRVVAAIGGAPVRQFRVVSGQDAYLSQNLQVHVGLGDAAVVDTLRVEWPSGTVDTYTGVAVRRGYRATEGGGLVPTAGEEGPDGAQGLRLEQNRPNPFGAGTTIRYALPASGVATLAVFDLLGREVATLVEGAVAAGVHEATWAGDGLPGGVYVCRLTAGGRSLTRRLVLLR